MRYTYDQNWFPNETRVGRNLVDEMPRKGIQINKSPIHSFIAFFTLLRNSDLVIDEEFKQQSNSMLNF